MKKLMITAAVLTLVLTLGTTGALACRHRAAPCANIGACAFVDADGDGICDNGDVHCAFVDLDGDGRCDNGDVHCPRYGDADGDGVCDNCANRCTHDRNSHCAAPSPTVGRHCGGHHGSSGHHHGRCR